MKFADFVVITVNVVASPMLGGIEPEFKTFGNVLDKCNQKKKKSIELT